MRIVIVGLGSIGSRHLANLRKLEPRSQIIAWRRTGSVSAGGRAPDSVVHSLDQALEFKPDVALICGPASTHVKTALQMARKGIHLFIEKPLSNSLRGVDELIEECRRRSLTLLVGYNFRFHPPLISLKRALLTGRIGRILSIRAEVGQYLPDWRPGRDYRLGVSGHRSLGGGALLELSHELDLARWLIGEVSGVYARVGRLSDLQIDVEDTAEILLQFKTGAIGSVHLDMTQRVAIRTCRVVGAEGTLLWDGQSDRTTIYRTSDGKWSVLHPGTPDPDEMYRGEMRHLLACIRGEETPRIDGRGGRRVLEIALAARKASRIPMVRL